MRKFPIVLLIRKQRRAVTGGLWWGLGSPLEIGKSKIKIRVKFLRWLVRSIRRVSSFGFRVSLFVWRHNRRAQVNSKFTKSRCG